LNRRSAKSCQGFQRAEYLLDHGMLDRVTHRKKLKDELVTILRMLMKQTPAVKGALPAPEDTAELAAPKPDEAVTKA